MLKELWDRKRQLNSGIQQMSVTLYTTRAQNQFKGYVQEMDEVDKVLTVFSRPKVFVAAQ